ncbi:MULTISPECIES: ketopantoate reductase family protein [unclassified Acidovorax]|uniref:ketopantoate reductase family protein n=1 Tax=unclassified Acidovorax TaxID=2684926 RepID=UPI001C44F2BF|nr:MULTISPECIES: ketopantoate reductase family protein [unclassified Acidovorax]MBV7426597.1 ketopantoate reductase family protein [Acidovorax sp. sif0732]MBV7447722.1 ketopantoate reductase family protein [Acidovorax sp. sif0715]
MTTAVSSSAPPTPGPLLRIAVMGAGAVGCYYGALLARAGHPVTLIGRPAHVQAVRERGLRLQTAVLDVQVPLAASTEASAVLGADVVLFCVKSSDSEDAARGMRPHLAPGALVLTLQNGVDNDERVRAVLGASTPVAAAVVYVATAMGGPGHVVHHGRGELVIAPSPRSGEAARQLTAAGIPTQVSDNVRGALWAKLVLNSAYNALSALSQQPYGPLVQVPGVTQVIADIVAECLAVAAADGVTIAGDVQAAVRGIAATMPGQFSSTAQDLARGKPTEIDHLNGYVVRRGAALGVPTPLNHALLVLVKLAEMKGAAG